MQGFNVQIGADVSNFNAGVQKVQQQLQKLPNVTNQSTLALSNLSRVAQDAPYGFIGIANNINPLLESFQRLKQTTGTTGGAFKAMAAQLTGPAGIGLAVGVVSSLLVTFGDRLFGASRAANETENAMKKLKDATKSVFENAGKEAAEVNSLIAVLKNETETRERKLLAIKELQRIQPDVFNSLKLEGTAVTGLDQAYKGYIENLKLTIAVKLRQLQLERLLTKQLELQGATQTKSINDLLSAVKGFENKRLAEARGKGDATGAGIISQILGSREARDKEFKQLQSDIDAAFKDMLELSKGVELTAKPDKIKLDPKKVEFKERVLEIPDMIDVKVRDLRIDTSTLKTGGFIDAFGEASKRIEAQLKPVRDQLMKLKELGEFVGNGIANAFSDAFTAIGKGENPIRALGEALKQLVLDLIQAALRAFIVKAIVNAFAPGLGSIANGGALSGLMGGIPGFAGGGQIAGRQLSIVGERGPELFVPSTSGRIVPNHQLNGIAGGALQAISISGTFRQSGRDLVAVVSRENSYQGRNV